MREIKFRMWSKEYQQMFGMAELAAMYTAMAKLAKKYVPEVSDSDVDMPLTGISLPFQDDAVLMQYTGLKGKNGKEIYEGDIVLSDYDDRKRVVEWCEEEACYKMRHLPNEPFCESLYFNDIDKCEVIGDIYTTPELLANE